MLFGGAIRSGKTQAAGRLLVETALQHPGVSFVVARLTYRELEDSTKKVMLRGDGALAPLIPPEVVKDYRASDNKVVLANGAEILFRSLDEPAKLLNLTLGGALIDQIEELDMGTAGELIFDTLIGRLSDPRGPGKLIAVANPASTLHWVYRRFVHEKTRDPDARYVHVAMSDNAQHLPADYVASMEATRESRPYWYRLYVLGEWGAIEGAAYPMFDERIHVVRLPDITRWDVRWESMDQGVQNPTAWLFYASDYDGNVVVCDSYYSPGLPQVHVAEVLKRRAAWWEYRDEQGWPKTHAAWADPSIRQSLPVDGRYGEPLRTQEIYQELGVRLVPANNERRTGFVQIAEYLTPSPERVFPLWHPRAGEKGAARLYFVGDKCEQLVEQIKTAPIASEDADPERGEAVDRRWESAHGHAHAALRYGITTRPYASVEPDELPEDPRHAAAVEAERRAWNDDYEPEYAATPVYRPL